MISSLGCSILLILSSIVASPTTPPQGKSFDELLDSLIAAETNRQTVLKKTLEVATERKSNVTLKFLEVMVEADEAFVNIRRFFDAGRIFFDFKKGKSDLKEVDAFMKTDLLRKENFLNDQMLKLAETHKAAEAQMHQDLPQDTLSLVQPIIVALKESEELIAPLGKQFQINLEATNKESPT
nr:PREDICTED: uncharacterized protein LOC109037654 [Bemisia tabaci]